MRADFTVTLDSCVLIPMPLADTLLRMAERPRLYIPKWSQDIMDEVSRNLTSKFGLRAESVARREHEIKKAFPDALTDDYQPLIPVMGNDPKDRHVLAVAVRTRSEVIVTYNKRHFPSSSLEPWGIECKGPSIFLQNLYDLEPAIVTTKLNEQAEDIRAPFEELLTSLRACVPSFVDYFYEEQGD